MAFSDSAEELKSLQRCMSDLISVLALPAVWSGQEPRQIVTTFHDALMAMLNLDFLYTRARTEADGKPIEVLKTAPHYTTTHGADEIRRSVNERFGDDPQKWPHEFSMRLDGTEIAALSMRLGLDGEIGIVIAGSERADFPTQAERLLLGVAANQAAVGLQQARLLSEQKRIADELEQRVAERTRKLAEINEELELQVGTLQHLPVSAWTLKPDGTPDLVNQVWLEFSGQTLDFVRSRPDAWMTAVHPDDRERASGVFWDGVRSGQGFAIETRTLRAQDGAYRWHLQQAVVLRDAEGKVLKFVGTTTDIDDQKRAEEKLRASEGKLRRVIDTIPTLSWCNLPDGSNEFLSKGWHDYTGLSPEEAHGSGWQAAFHPEDLPPLMKRWQELLISGEPGEIEARLRRHDGEYRWFLIRVAPFRNESGEILRWYGTSTDINDRKRAEDALRASEINLHQILDRIPGLVCAISPSGQVELANQPLMDYFGMTVEELNAWETSGEVHPDDLARVTLEFTRSITTGTPYEAEIRYRRADGVYRWFQARALPARDAGGRITCWYSLITDIEDRKRAEDELKRSEARHRVVVETASDAVVSIDESGAIILANPATKRIFGYNPEELIGKPLAALMPEAMRKLHETGFKRYLETGARHLNWRGTEVTALRANGEEFPVEVSFGEMAADQKKVFTGFIRDISEKKRSEEAILASERNLSLIINTMPVLTWSARPDGGAEFLNQQWLEYSGLSAEQAKDWGWIATIHPGDLDRVSNYWKSAIASGEPVEIEARMRRFDGAFRWFLFRANPLRNDAGNIVKWYGTNVDIEDRKRSEEALRESEQRFRLIVDGIAGLVAIMSPTGAVEDVNLQVLTYFGMTVEQLKGWSTSNAVHPDDMPAVVSAWTRSVETASVYDTDHRLRRADGVYRWFHARGLPLCDAEGRVLRWYVLLTDIDDRKQAEEALTQARTELAHVTRVTSLGVLTASIAHEVNQPLSGIVMNASTCVRMLDTDPPNIEGARETARRTIRDGNRASEVITRLRALFRKKDVAIESVDLSEAAREVIAMSLIELQRNRVILKDELADNLPRVRGDRIQLQQVIVNLLRNASDAMTTVNDRPRDLLVRTELGGNDGIRLSVIDAGAGFDPQLVNKLFDGFYTTKSDGMGIGLSVSRSIVEAHRGRLWATLNDGPGATFTFSLPIGSPEPPVHTGQVPELTYAEPR